MANEFIVRKGLIIASGSLSGSSTSTGSFGRVEATTLSGDGAGLTNLAIGSISGVASADEISGSWQGHLSSSAMAFVGGGVSGSATSTGSFGQVIGADKVIGEDVAAYSNYGGAGYETRLFENQLQFGYNGDVDATAEQLDGSTSGLDVACKRVDLIAGKDNTGIIYVGGSDTIGPLTAGMELNAGDFYSIDINNLNQIWIEASVANQTLRYLYYT